MTDDRRIEVLTELVQSVSLDRLIDGVLQSMTDAQWDALTESLVGQAKAAWNAGTGQDVISMTRNHMRAAVERHVATALAARNEELTAAIESAMTDTIAKVLPGEIDRAVQNAVGKMVGGVGKKIMEAHYFR